MGLCGRAPILLDARPAARSLAAERRAAASGKRVDSARGAADSRGALLFLPRRKTAGERLASRPPETALRGGENGVDIVPGKSSESSLVQRISAVNATIRMPPEGQRLDTAAVSVIRRWIEQERSGRPIRPACAPPARIIGRSSRSPGRRFPQSAMPSVPYGEFFHNAIDAFVAANLARHHLSPSPPADRRTLIRRVYFDLIGLPPTPGEVAAFAADNTPGVLPAACRSAVGKPAVWQALARHWIDVVHFAETHGHDEDLPRPNAWPYRDYLIRSFNDDKPYARFVSEQVAGDVLYPNDPQATVALGFLAAGPWDQSSLRNIVDDTIDKKQAQLLDRDDVVMNVMSTFTSTTVHCARCHDHKFDPISQTDYYALQAVFAGVDRAEREYVPDPAVRRTCLLKEQRNARQTPGPVSGCKQILDCKPKWRRPRRSIAAAATSGKRLKWRSEVTTKNGSVGNCKRTARSCSAAGHVPTRTTIP